MTRTARLTSLLHSWSAHYALWCVWLGSALIHGLFALAPGWNLVSSALGAAALCALLWPMRHIRPRELTSDDLGALKAALVLVTWGGLCAAALVFATPLFADIPEPLVGFFQVVFGLSVGRGLYIVSHLSWALRRARWRARSAIKEETIAAGSMTGPYSQKASLNKENREMEQTDLKSPLDTASRYRALAREYMLLVSVVLLMTGTWFGYGRHVPHSASQPDWLLPTMDILGLVLILLAIIHLARAGYLVWKARKLEVNQ